MNSWKPLRPFFRIAKFLELPILDSKKIGIVINIQFRSALLSLGMVMSLAFSVSSQTTINSNVITGSDDAEEIISSGSTDITGSSDLEMIREGSNDQIVGIRFTGLNIPPGATITNAYFTFMAKADHSSATNLVIKAQAADNPGTFTTADYNISGRTTTAASYNWSNVPAWTDNQTYTSPSFAPVVQEIVNRAGWVSGNSIVFIITGSGTRNADSYDGSASDAPKLTVTFTTCSPTIGTPVFSLGASSIRCQGSGSETYTAASTNSTGMSYSLDPASLSAGNTINTFTGEVTYVDGWNGSSTITATATGCNGPKTSTHIASSVSVGIPDFSLGSSSERCKALGNAIYTAIAPNSTGLSYTLDFISLLAGNTINPSTGEVTFVSGWTGTSTITAIAVGCNGPAVATHKVATKGVLANDDTATGLQGNPLIINVLFNDLCDIDLTSVSVVSQPTGGSLQIGPSGQVAYLPNGSFFGLDEFTYQVCSNGPVVVCDYGKVSVNIEESYIDPCAESTRSKTFYLPFPENTTQLRKALWSVAGSSYLTNTVRSVISLKMPYPGTFITYDHWEDGYESDIAIPVQSTTEVWGDGKLDNGVAPGYPSDIIPAGGYLYLDNQFAYNPRVVSEVVFDGKDKLHSTNDIAVSKISGDAGMWTTGPMFAVQNVKTNVVDISRFGRLFILPFGEDISGAAFGNTSAFRYTGVFAKAATDSTVVELDYDADGTVDLLSPVLNEGEVWFYDGTANTPGSNPSDVNKANDIKAGAVLTSNHPIGVDLIFGGIDGSGYSTRNLAILPGAFYSSTYYTPVHTTNSGAPVYAFFTNSLSASITINWKAGTGASGTLAIPANGATYLSLSEAAGYKFQSQGGESYTAIAVIDADASGAAYDWSFNMIPESRLSSFTSLAWAPGSDNLSGNYNPVWVTAPTATTLYIKYDGNLVTPAPITSSCGIPYDIAVPMAALQSYKIFDTDNDQSGLAIYTCDGTNIIGVWGQDPNAGGPTPKTSPAQDVGYVMESRCMQQLVVANDDLKVTEPDIPIIIGVLSNDFGFLCKLDKSSVDTLALLQASNGTIVINPNGTITYTPNPGFEGTDQFEYRVCSDDYPDICDVATVTIKVTDCFANAYENLINGKIFIEQLADNGTYDDETGAAGVKVNLYADVNCNGIIDGDDGIQQSTISDLSGNYSFSTANGLNVKDDFDPIAAFNGNDGGVSWDNNWSEVSDDGNINAGDVRVIADASSGGLGNAIRLSGSNNGINRSRTFIGATGAMLKFSYRRQDLNRNGEAVNVQLNGLTIHTINDGGSVGTDVNYSVVTIPLTTHNPNGVNTIQFITNGKVASNDFFWIDNVEMIYYVGPSCSIVKVDPTNTGDAYTASSLNKQSAIFTGLGTCDKNNYLGVLANLVASNDVVNTAEDRPVVVNVLANDVIGQPDPATVTTTATAIQPANGVVIVNPDGTITYTPNANFTGIDQFEYEVCSLEDPQVCSIALVTVNVSCISIPLQNTITGIVFTDLDVDGIFDTGEPGFTAVDVNLYHDLNGNAILNAGEPLVSTETTSSQSTYQFDITPPTTASTYLDGFNANTVANQSNGTANWTDSWTEIGETDGFGAGDLRITSANGLRIQSVASTTKGAYRTANLSTAISATLSFKYTEIGLDLEVGDYVDVMVATSATPASWTLLKRLSGADGNQSGLLSYNITPYLSATTTIRFVSSGSATMIAGDIVYFDDVQISYQVPTPASYIVQLAQPIPTGYTLTTPVPSPNGMHTASFTAAGAGECQYNFGLAGADVAITISASQDTVVSGNPLTYTIVVTNNGPSTALNVTATDNLPVNLTSIIATPSQGTWSAPTWTIGILLPGQSDTLTLTGTVDPNQCSPLTNSASVTSSTSDPYLANNVTEVITTIVLDQTDPTITECAINRDVAGCSTSDISGPAFSNISTVSSESVFENGINQGIVSDNCTITEVTYIDVASGSCPIIVMRTWTIKDAEGHSVNCTQEITVSPAVALGCTISETKGISCNGDSDGEVTATPVGGCSSYTYLWNTTPAQSTAIATGLSAGTYDVTVTDGNGCTATESITIQNPQQLAVSVDIISDFNGQDLSCKGAADGAALANVIGGVGDYLLLWSDGQTGDTVTNLSAGTYFVTVTDDNGCNEIETVTLNDPSEINALISASSPPSTCEGSDGSITITASGGTESFKYKNGLFGTWQSSNIFNNLVANNYDIYVSNDEETCQVGPLSITLDGPAPQSCPIISEAVPLIVCGADTTSFSVEPSIDALGYLWDLPSGAVILFGEDTDSIVVDLNNIASGNYDVCVKTVSNCGYSPNCCFSFEIEECLEICGNGIDDDGNGLTDCNDPACEPIADIVLPGPSCVNTEVDIEAVNAGSGASYSWDFGSDATPSKATGIGPHNVIFDACGNMEINLEVSLNGCTNYTTGFLLIEDNTQPTLSGVPSDVTVECESVPSAASPTASDNCDTSVSIVYNESRTDGSCADSYTLTRNWTATDECGNSKTETQIITVEDNTQPTLSGVPSDVTVECESVPSAASPTASDNCDASVSIVYNENRTDGSCLDSYTLTRSWTATDECGNSKTETQIITVEDNTQPTLSGVPSDVTVECESVPDAASPTASDNCDPTVSIIYNETRTDGSCADSYTLNRTWTATDECGNSKTKTQIITVEDTTQPTLSGVPSDVTVACESVPSAASPTASDNCDPTVSIVYNETRTDGSCTDSYTLTRSWTATDECGNSKTETQIITVEDNTQPTLSGVPSDVTVECESVPSAASPTASDNCDATVSIVYNESRTDGSCADSYTLTRSWTATDECGNSKTETQIITVADNTNPILIGVPADITVHCDEIPTVPTTTATDNCDADTDIIFSEVQTSGTSSDHYFLTRSWTANDNCNNVITESQTIKVIDSIEVIIDPFNSTTCVGGMVQFSVLPQGPDYSYNWSSDFGSFNDDDIYNPILTTDAEGVYTIELTVFYASGCFGTAITTLTVNQDLNTASATSNGPVCIGNDIELYGNGGDSYQWNGPNGFTSTDQNPVIPNVVSAMAGQYTLNISDIAGCTAEKTVDVAVTPVINATFTTQAADCDSLGAIDVLITSGSGNYSFDWADLSQPNEPQNRTELPPGSYDVTISDDSGCEFIINGIAIIDDCEPCDAAAGNLTIDNSTVCFENGEASISATPMGNMNAPPGFGIAYLLSKSPGNAIIAIENIAEFVVNSSGNYTIHTLVFDLSVNVSDSIVLNQTTIFEIDALLIQGGGSICGDLDLSGASVEVIELLITVDSLTEDYCSTSNGSATLSPGNLSFSWSDGGMGSVRNDLSAGTYQITATDGNSCSTSIEIVIDADCDCVMPDITAQIVDSECGESIGVATLNPDGNNTDYSYNWSTTDGDLNTLGNEMTNLFAGVYTVTVTSLLTPNCFSIETIIVENVTGSEPDVVTISPATCEASNGAVEFSPTSYIYIWLHDSLTAFERYDLPVGTYQVSVYDSLNPDCENVINIDVNQNNPLTSELTIYNQPGCNQVNGNVNIQMTGGSGNYHFLWNDNSSLNQAWRDDLAAGSYFCTVTDQSATNCRIVVDFTLNNFVSGVTLSLDPLVSVSCNGQSDGSVNYNATYDPGFDQPAQEIIQDSLGNIFSNGSLPEGDYCLIITDANDCVGATECFSVTEPEVLEVSYLSLDGDCDNGGSIDVTVTGGNGIYTFNWADLSGGVEPEDRLDLTAGSYSLTVSDGNGCSAVAFDIIIGFNDGMAIQIIENIEATCDLANGSIILSPNTYHYDWSDGATGAERDDLIAGIYTVTISTATCSNELEIVIGSSCLEIITDTIYVTTLINTPIDSICFETIELPGNFVSISSCGDPENGTWIINPADSCVTYIPNDDFIGNDTACIVVCDDLGICDTTIVIITVLDLDCEDIVENNLNNYFIQHCNSDSLICFNIPLNEISNYEITDNGAIFNGDFIGCNDQMATIYSYLSLPDQGNSGPYQLDDWTVDGITFSGKFFNIKNLVDSMNIWNPFGNWQLDPQNFIIFSENIDQNCGKLEVTQIQSQIHSSIASKQNTVPKGLALDLVVGAHEIVFNNTTTGCIDTVDILVACINDEVFVDTIFVSEIDTFCIDTTELFGNIISIENVCEDLSGEFVLFELIDGVWCVSYEGVEVGTEEACIVVCDDLGFCDTTYMFITVEEMYFGGWPKPPIAVDDFENIGQNETINIEVLENDTINGILESIYIVTPPANGSATLNQNGTITYSAETGFCDPIEPDTFTYAICNPIGCDTATVSIIISCKELIIYTGVSPNDDGVNDVFFIENIEDYPNNIVSVYNRWGNEVFYQKSYKNDWNGTWKNKHLPDGTYFYILEDGAGKSYSGYIQILR